MKIAYDAGGNRSANVQVKGDRECMKMVNGIRTMCVRIVILRVGFN